MWCNGGESLALFFCTHQEPCFRCPVIVSVVWAAATVPHTLHAFARPETNRCYRNNFDNPWIIRGGMLGNLRTIPGSWETRRSALPFVIVNACEHLAHASLFFRRVCQVPRWEIQLQWSLTWSQQVLHLVWRESEHTEARSKDSPPILSCKQKRLHAASDWKLLTIPGEQCDMIVGKRGFEVACVAA